MLERKGDEALHVLLGPLELIANTKDTPMITSTDAEYSTPILFITCLLVRLVKNPTSSMIRQVKCNAPGLGSTFLTVRNQVHWLKRSQK